MTRNPRTRRIWKRIALGLGILVVVLIAAFFIFRGSLLRYVLKKAESKALVEYGITLDIKGASWSGLSGVVLEDFKAKSQDKKIIAHLKGIKAQASIWSIIKRDPQLLYLKLESAAVDVDQVLKIKPKKADATPVDTVHVFKVLKLAQKGYKYYNQVRRLVPDELDVKNFSAIYHKDSLDQTEFKLTTATIIDQDLNFQIQMSVGLSTQKWKLHGALGENLSSADLQLESSDGALDFSLANRLLKTYCSVDKLRFKFNGLQSSTDEVTIDGGLFAQNFSMFDARLSPDTVIVYNGGVEGKVRIDTTGVEVDSNSVLSLNKIKANLGLAVNLSAPMKYGVPRMMDLSFRMLNTDASTIPTSLPIGLFDITSKLELAGTIDYRFRFHLNTLKRDSVYLRGHLASNDFKLVSSGAAQLEKVNSSFEHQPFNSKRVFTIGPANPSFIPYGQISPYMINAVMSMEDPHFFTHKGFEPTAIEYALLSNLQSNAFKKGGSTISQQLIKNIYLTQKKTIDRKIEEAFLVWLVEHGHVIEHPLGIKKRMLEIYLNAIEFGPEVYGIGEASQFYYAKPPNELTLAEAIFLAHIIRSPKKFMYNFGPDGNLNSRAVYLEQRTASHMHRLRMISDEAWGAFWAEVKLTGRAGKSIKKTVDTLEIDSVLLDDDW